MKVFRLCREDEVRQIMNTNSFENVGSYYSNNGCNIHTYLPDKKYLHFFTKKSDLLYLRSMKGRYICEYEIPQWLCDTHTGIGKYWDYVDFCELIEVKELAIPTDCIKMNYLKSINKIVKDIDYEDIIENPNLTEFTQEIYAKEVIA